MDALIWARDGASIASTARALSIPRTTYDSYEKGTANPPVEVLTKLGEIKGLQRDWWRNFEPRNVDGPILKRQGGIQSVPLLPVPSIGFITKGTIRDKTMQTNHEPVLLPANMVRPEYVIALADVNDTGMMFPQGCPLLFDPTKTAVIGQRVAVELRDGTSSLRRMDWDADHVVYTSFNGKSGLLEHECDPTGLLVGAVPANKVGKFNADYDADGI